ncbi:MAG TPA: mRNA surveillance protein pelota [Candidatus Bathyarchaeota archaeon]|nr:mRNA surveillance protein pelota [Candidatus Bathyarchaeota archaeon]
MIAREEHALKIIAEDLRHGRLKLKPENLDDLWTLYNVIQPGDHITAKTTREVRPEGEARQKKGRRKLVTLRLEVKRATWDRALNRLRVLGVIREAPEELEALGKHHTITIKPGTPFLLEKEQWPKYMLEQIRKATEVEQTPVVIVAIDDEEYAIAVLRHRGPEVKTEEKTRLPGKLEAERRESAVQAYLAEAAKALSSVWREVGGPIVIAGPAYMKNRLHNHLREKHPELAERVSALVSTSSAGQAGVYEAIRSGALDKVLANIRMMEESQAVKELLTRIGKGDGRAVYGEEQTERAAQYGAVETLLITDEKLRTAQDDRRKALENIMHSVEKQGGKIIIVSTEHEAGKNLRSLGGIAALLRFPIQYNNK